MGYLALFVALSATAWAAPKLAKDSVKSKQIKDGQVKSVDVEDNGLTGADIQESSLDLPTGPKGATGPQGPAGPTGLAGADGSPDTAAQILAKLLGVDGSGSGLDADQLDGQSSAAFAPGGHTHSGGAGGSIVDGTITDADISTTATIAEGKLATQMGVMTGRIDGLNGSPDVFGGPSGLTIPNATESAVTMLSPNVTTTASALSVKLTQGPGAGQSRTFALFVNGASSGLSCQILNSGTTCNSGATTVTIPAGATLSLSVDNTGIPSAASALFGWRLR